MRRFIPFFCAVFFALFSYEASTAAQNAAEAAFELVNGGKCLTASSGMYIVDGNGKTVSDKYRWIDIPDDMGLMKVNVGGTLQEDGSVKGGSYGFIDSDGSVVVQPKYEYVSDFDSYGLAVVNDGCKLEEDIPVGGKFGYIDRTGKYIVPVEYDFIGEFDENGICWVNKGGSRFTSDKNVELQMESVAKREKKTAAIARKRDELEDAVTTGRRDVLSEKVKGGLHGLFDRNGNKICEVEYQRIDPFYDGFCRIRKKNLYGFMNTKGREISSCLYTDAPKFFTEGIAWVETLEKKEKRYGYIRNDGTVLSPCIYKTASDFCDGVAVVSTPVAMKAGAPVEKVKYSLLGRDGKMLDSKKYDGVYMRSENMMFCHTGNRYIVVNSAGKELTPAVIITARPFKNARAVVKISSADAAVSPIGSALQKASAPAPSSDKGMWVLIDNKGIVLSKGYENIRQATEGFFPVKAGKWGFIDADGKECIPAEYEAVDAVFSNMASVKDSSGKWGLIEVDGRIIVPFTYDAITSVVSEGVIPVRDGSKWGGIAATDGSIIVPFVMDASDDVVNIARLMCPGNDGKQLSLFDVSLYVSLKKGRSSRFNLNDTIAGEYWDY